MRCKRRETYKWVYNKKGLNHRVHTTYCKRGNIQESEIPQEPTDGPKNSPSERPNEHLMSE